jgi:Uma2 family endonuclease
MLVPIQTDVLRGRLILALRRLYRPASFAVKNADTKTAILTRDVLCSGREKMRRAALPWRQPPLTEDEENELFMLMLEDDTEDAPWMTMGDLQFWSASGFAHSLRQYAHELGLPWYVASMHPILYTWGSTKKKHQLAPDVYVAFRPEHPRPSFDVAVEGSFPPFVLEVVSPSSTTRDRAEKRTAYELLDVEEYALFTPHATRPATLRGYRRRGPKRFETWQPDAKGRLWSKVLGLYLVVQETLLRAQTPDGRILLTLEESEAARREAEAARQTAEVARQEADGEIERLRREIERLRNPSP